MQPARDHRGRGFGPNAVSMRHLLRPGLCAALLLCALGGARAQMLRVEAGAADPDVLRFNPEFIARNNVVSVAGQAWVKRENKPMVALDRHFLYRFAADGKLGYANNSFGKPGSGMDTASVRYSYNAKGQLIQELRNDVHGFFALRMQYDAQGRPDHVEHVRMENAASGRYQFIEGPATVISDERFEYAQLNDTTLRKTWLNDQGRAYQEEVYTHDKLGYLRSIDRRNLITQRRGRISFTYNEQGRLSERSEQPDLGQQHWTSMQWTYDGAGNPLTRDLLRDGLLMQHTEYLYAEGSMLLKALITKNNETGAIDVVRYEVVRQ